METQDGFIVGVYNYCDRWCERCSLASRCRVYATELQMAVEPPEPAAVTAPGGTASSPLLRSLGAVAAWFTEGTAEGAGDSTERADQAVEPLPAFGRPPLPPSEADLHRRVHVLGMRLWDWPAPERSAQDAVVAEALELIHHFAVYIGPKVFRALNGRKVCEEDGMLSDALGSAKASLLAFDRMGDAWLRLAEHGAISVLDAAPILTELQQLSSELEAIFPNARAFIRPGFDEPQAVAMLEWRERG